MGPTVAVEYGAVKDEKGKFARLAVLLGLADADHARGKCEHLWMACATREEAKIGLPVWLVEQVLGESGPQALVDAELADFARTRGDTKMRRLVMHKAADHCDWKRRNRDQASKGGKSRAKDASRSSGRFTSDNQPGSLVENQPSSSSSSSSSSSPDLDPEDQERSLPRDPAVPPAVPVPHQQYVPPIGQASNEVEKSEPPTTDRAGTVQVIRTVHDRAIPPPAPITPQAKALHDGRRALFWRCWQLAGEAFARVQASGIDAHAPNGWSGTPDATSPPAQNLLAIIAGMLVGDRPDFAAAEAKIANRIAVAEAEARAMSPPSARYMTPARIWNRDSFAIAVDMTPEQAATPVIRASRAGPKSSAARANSDPKIGRIEPPPASAFRGGIQKL